MNKKMKRMMHYSVSAMVNSGGKLHNDLIKWVISRKKAEVVNKSMKEVKRDGSHVILALYYCIVSCKALGRSRGEIRRERGREEEERKDMRKHLSGNYEDALRDKMMSVSRRAEEKREGESRRLPVVQAPLGSQHAPGPLKTPAAIA